MASANSGVSTLTADGCAGCHRAHTAQGYNLLAQPDEEALCLSCHGAAGTGATTDVESGVQYTLANDGTGTQPVLGALRNGGFVDARIDSSDPTRLTYATSRGGNAVLSTHAKVSVLAAGLPVTSAHLDLDGAGGVVAQGVAWGNIAGDAGTAFDAADNSGGTVAGMTCASCHNPHGNGLFRILNPIPEPQTDTTSTFEAATTGVEVTDGPDLTTGETRNYTVIQEKGGTLLASDVEAIPGYSNSMGDYFHRTVPWDPNLAVYNPTGTNICDPTVDSNDASQTDCSTSSDMPNGQSTFNAQITAWCATCHSRYLANNTTAIPQQNPTTDAIFTYRHGTSRTACTTCHVAHGSNALMEGTYSSDFPYPGGTVTSASSRLLKIDNRGTCQACHDPTETVEAGTLLGPVPAPYVP